MLVAGATALAAGSAGLLLTGRSPLWLLLAKGGVIGAQNGLNILTNQTAMYAQAPRTRPAGRLRPAINIT